MANGVKLTRRSKPQNAEKADYIISVKDDLVMQRYAVGGRDGIIKGYRDECNYTIVGQNFIVKTGKIVVDGSDVEIIGNPAASVNVGTNSSLVYWVVYLEVDRQISTASDAHIKAVSQTSNYPPVPTPNNDLTVNLQGIARRELYRFTAQGGLINDIVRTMPILDYPKDKIETGSLTTGSATITSATITNILGGYAIPAASIPTNVVETIANLTGNGTNVVAQTGTLQPGWYRVELAGAGGGAGGAGASNDNSTAGYAGGYLSPTTFFVPYPATYIISAGGAGSKGTTQGAQGVGPDGGNGGGSSDLSVLQLGLLFTATGGQGGTSAYGGTGQNAYAPVEGYAGGCLSGGDGPNAGGGYVFKVLGRKTLGVGGNNLNNTAGGGAGSGQNGYANLTKLG